MRCAGGGREEEEECGRAGKGWLLLVLLCVLTKLSVLFLGSTRSRRDLINPYMIRRMKADVALDLPEKTEQVLFCRLTPFQRALYKKYLKSSDVHDMLEGRKMIFAGLQVMRKLCNHPSLVAANMNANLVPMGVGNGEDNDGGGAADDDTRKGDPGAAAANDVNLDFIKISRSFFKMRRPSEGAVRGAATCRGMTSRRTSS